MQRFLQVITVVIALVAVGSPAAGADGLTPLELKNGRKLYVAKCARCHKFYHPAQYSVAEWKIWMDKMSRKAKLKPDQNELLSRYLETYRTGSNTNHPGR